MVDKFAIPLIYSIAFGIPATSFTIIGILANIVVVVAILGAKRMRNSTMCLLLLNLAISDLIGIISYAPFWVPRMVSGRLEWILPSWVCNWLSYFPFMGIGMSMLTYIAIAVESTSADVLMERRAQPDEKIFHN
ncbi:7 transmembrane receptor (rhodopsin family) domain-containing protein [Ditylenchus destructor]|nr:7 transmembrane receptor (rhodopsin family) domain-containing protein [Ditylenchus destructor]